MDFLADDNKYYLKLFVEIQNILHFIIVNICQNGLRAFLCESFNNVGVLFIFAGFVRRKLVSFTQSGLYYSL